MMVPGRRASRWAWRTGARRPFRCVAPALALLTVACAGPPRPADVAVIASGTDLESGNPLVTIHPLSRQVQRHMLYVTLTRLDAQLQPEPYLARRWAWGDAHRRLTLHLATSVRWHDGIPTTAADVAFTLDAVRDPDLGAPRAGELAVLDSVRALDDSTLVIWFRSPQPAVPSVLAELPVVPRHLLDSVPRERWRGHPFSTAPVGNGPFRFAGREAGRRWRFERNDAFPVDLGGPPRLAAVVIAVVDEAATKFAGLVSGALDMAGVSPAMAHLVERDPSLELRSPPVLFSTGLAFNTTRPPFDDARVRRAVSLSLRRSRIAEAAVAGYATPAGSAIPPGLPVAPLRPAEEDSAAAAALLDAAGWSRGRDGIRRRDGQPLRLALLSAGGGDLAVEQLVQADLGAQGIDLRIEVREMASLLSTLRAAERDYDVVYTGIPGDIGLGHLRALFHGAQRGGALDYTGYHTDALDRALDAARDAPVLDDARRAWGVVDSLLRDATPVAWVYHARGVQGLSRRLDGVDMDLRGELVSVSRWTAGTTP